MTTPVIRCMLAVLAAALCACATTSAPQRESQADPGANIAAWRTFALKDSLGQAAGDEPLRMLDVNIRNAIRAELTKRGYSEAEAQAQFLVTYETAAQEKMRSSPVRIGIGMGSWGGNVGGSVGMSTPSVENYREGRLVIHAIDAAANREVWYGAISGRVDKQNLDAEAVARAVALAMQDFPASAAGPPP